MSWLSLSGLMRDTDLINKKNHFILNVSLANFSFPLNGIFFHFSYFYLHYILYDNGRSFFCCIVLLFIYSYYFFALVPFLLLYPSNNKHKDLSNFSYLTLFCTFFFSFSHLTEHTDACSDVMPSRIYLSTRGVVRICST